MIERSIGDVRRDAQKVSKRVTLDQIHLTGVAFTSSAELEAEKYRVETSLEVRCSKRGGTVVVATRHQSVARPEISSNDEVRSWEATVEYEAVFQITSEDDEFTDDEFTAFGIEVATDIIHPYAREVTQSLTAKSQFPAFTIGRSKSIWEQDPEQMIEIESTEMSDEG